MGKKRSCEWKPCFPHHKLSKGFEGLASFEELEDYNLEDYVNVNHRSEIKKGKDNSKSSKNLKKSVITKKRESTNEWIVTSLKRKTLENDTNNDHVNCGNKINSGVSCVSSEHLGQSDKDEIRGMEAWSTFKLENCILKALSQLGFTKPTDIQAQTLHAALGRKDILGAAETGSGKTLAFGIPIIQGILRMKRRLGQGVQKFGEDEEERNSTVPSLPPKKNLYALILTPTRELAVQIKSHLTAVAKFADVTIALVVGGLATQKQERLLNRRPDIVVATPGRLWEMIERRNEHLLEVDNISFLAIDETDRMLERGHFQELQTLLGQINIDEAKKKKRQNFVFSATLTMVHEPPKYVTKGQKAQISLTPGQKLQQIISCLGITQPKIVDITSEKGTASSLSEARILCSIPEKDSYLYYFVLNHSGRTLVFCNSISCVRRLAQVFQILKRKLYPLHAHMEQKQRLRNLEHFRDDPNGILLATDVAARGLDIPDVQHVIHYEVPQTTEGYVHRSGRTARAKKEGLTVIIMEPRETVKYINLFRSLGRDRELPDFPVDYELLDIARVRVTLAREIEHLEHKSRRNSSQINWFQKAAKEMDMLLDEDQIPKTLNDKESQNIKQQVNVLKKQLNSLLRRPILPRTMSLRFPNPSEVQFSGPESAIEKVKKKKRHRFVKLLK